jgi:DNA helicase-2/ATP-dependent DNA helicase PcrA
VQYPVVKEELSLLETVLAQLEGPEEGGSQTNYDELLTSLRDSLATAKPEDQAPLIEQMYRIAALAQQHGRGRLAPVDKNSPYFGHLRLREQEAERDVLIGRVSHVDARRGLRIVDWRNAPVSRLYYCYDEGDDYQETFGTRPVSGHVSARRSVTVSEGRLQRVSSASGTYSLTGQEWRQLSDDRARLQGGQGAALRPTRRRPAKRKLGVGPDGTPREDKFLPEITALIDRHQFAVITHPDSGVVVIRGGAGSGKTTVGLHRIAYLAYHDPKRYRPDQMLVVVYNHALANYIGHVLPSLGLPGVRVVTFSDWAASLRRRHVRGLPRHYASDTPPAVTRVKRHPNLLAALAHLTKGRDGRHPRAIIEAWAEAMTDGPLLRRFLVDEARQPLPQADVDVALAWNVRQQRELEESTVEDPSGWLDREDDALLLRLYQLLRGPLRSTSNRPLGYEHIMVDETQDLAPVELALLHDAATPRASITLAGDAGQKLDSDSGFDSWEDLFADLDLAPHQITPLKISYRSTAEIMELAQHVLGPCADPLATYAPTRSGAPVELLRLGHDGEAVAVLGQALRELATQEPLASVALVSRFPERANLFYHGLRRAEVPRLRRVADQDFTFRPGVDVTDIRQVKGLEFDYVILLDVDQASYPMTNEARHLLHIGATRAAHQLWLLCTAPPSPLLPDWLTNP